MPATSIQPAAPAAAFRIIVRYHTPRAHIREGSRTTRRGCVHIHVANGPATFTSARSRTSLGGAA